MSSCGLIWILELTIQINQKLEVFVLLPLIEWSRQIKEKVEGSKDSEDPKIEFVGT